MLKIYLVLTHNINYDVTKEINFFERTQSTRSQNSRFLNYMQSLSVQLGALLSNLL